MASRKIILMLDEDMIAKLDQEVAESQGVYMSRSQLLRQLLRARHPATTVTLPPPKLSVTPPKLSVTPPKLSIEAALAQAEAEYQREMGTSPVG